MEKNGIVDALTKALVGLYEEPEKPENPIDFIKQFLGGAGEFDLDAMKSENEELKKKVEVLEAKVEEYQKKERPAAEGPAVAEGAA